MDHDIKSSEASSALVPENQTEGCLLEDVNNILLFDEFNESAIVADLMTDKVCNKQENSSYSARNTSNSSRIHDSYRTKLQSQEENVSFTDIFGNKTEQLKTRQSFNSVDIGDEFFFPSDVGKEMLLKDQEDHVKEFLTENDTNCTSWTVRSRISLPDTTSMLLDDCDDTFTSKRHCSVGEYMRKLSEPLGAIAYDVFHEKVYFGCNASTPMVDRNTAPMVDRNTMFELPETEDTVQYKHGTPAYVPPYDNIWNLKTEPHTPLKTMHFTQMFLYSVKKKNYSEDYKYCINSEIYKKIEKLEAEERKRSEPVENLFSFNCSNDSIDTVLEKLPGSEDTTLEIGIPKPSIENGEEKRQAQAEDSVTDKWIVEPQELTLHVDSKGYRLLLMSNSKTDLKFKTRFDSKITNVCPISGILPAKGKIGLRILVSNFIKKRFKEDIEDSVVIMCGKNEQVVLVKICEKQEPKNLSQKNRSFICF